MARILRQAQLCLKETKSFCSYMFGILNITSVSHNWHYQHGIGESTLISELRAYDIG